MMNTKSRLTLLLLALLAASHASATVTFSLTVYRQVQPAYGNDYGQTWFLAFPSLHDTTPPLSHHRVESPTDICSANFGTNTGSGAFVFTDGDAFFQQLTNGQWKLWLNKGTPQETLYFFTVASLSFHVDALGPVAITAPRDGGINIPSNTPYAWSGPTNWDFVSAEAVNYYGDFLDPADVEWPSGPILDPGTNQFLVSYGRDVSAEVTISTPTNGTAGLLSDWAVGAVQFRSEARSGFIVEGLPPSPLAVALDAPGMIWETAGDADWFSQASVTRDGTDAARSGAIGDEGHTVLRTVLYGANVISFWWKADTEEFDDRVEFTDNGNFVAELSGATDWVQATHLLTGGEVHVLEWTYYKDGADAEGLDAVFLDQVSLGNGPPPLPEGQPVSFSLTLMREQKHAFDGFAANQLWFLAFPALDAPTNPISYHRVESPSNEFFGPLCSANFGPTNGGAGSDVLLSFDELAERLTNGVWRLWLNKDTPQEEVYAFTLTALNFASNDLGVVVIASPADGSSGVATNPPYQWSGPEAWDDIFVQAYGFAPFSFYGSEMLPPTATTWPTGPAVLPGTNVFSCRYARQAGTNFVTSTPFLLWTYGGVRYESAAEAAFVVGAAPSGPLLDITRAAPGQVTISWTPPTPGFVLQERTNLTLSGWTNAPGGATNPVTVPATLPAKFYRLFKP